MCLEIWTCYRHHYAYSNEETYLQYFLEILKRTLQNFSKILKKYFFVFSSSWWIMNKWMYGHSHNNHPSPMCLTKFSFDNKIQSCKIVTHNVCTLITYDRRLSTYWKHAYQMWRIKNSLGVVFESFEFLDLVCVCPFIRTMSLGGTHSGNLWEDACQTLTTETYSAISSLTLPRRETHYCVVRYLNLLNLYITMYVVPWKLFFKIS